jgi:hypothetical protein
MRPSRVATAALIGYGLVGLAAYWPIFPGDTARLPSCACADTVQSTWFLGWVPYAVAHGHNPLFTSWLNHPAGANLAQNTLMPLLGLLAAPVTALAGPVASFNLLAWLAFPLSGISMYYVVRRLFGSSLAAVVAGLIYIVSPYMTGQATDHIMLSFLPLPPLIVLSLWQLIVRQDGRALRTGLLLGLEVIVQFLIEPEVLAMTALAAGICGLVAVLADHQFVNRDRVRYAIRGLGPAAAVSAVVLAYPIWFLIAGPHHFSGPNFPRDNPWRSDLAGVVVPTLDQRIVPHAFHHFAAATGNTDYQEVGTYLSLPLFVLLLAAVVRWRRDRRLIVTSIGAAGCWVLSLGPRLTVYGHVTHVPLPFVVFAHLPLLENILPGRIAFGMWLLLAIAVAITTDRCAASLRAEPTGTAGRRLRLVAASALVAASVAALLPRWPIHAAPVQLPPAFAHGGHSTIAANSIVLAYPYPVFPQEQAMLWQATSGFRFKLLGGYVQMVDPYGHQTLIPPLLNPPTVQEWMATEAAVGAPWPHVGQIPAAAIRRFIRVNHVDVVVLDQSATGAGPVSRALTAALGTPLRLAGRILMWQPGG